MCIPRVTCLKRLCCNLKISLNKSFLCYFSIIELLDPQLVELKLCHYFSFSFQINKNILITTFCCFKFTLSNIISNAFQLSIII